MQVVKNQELIKNSLLSLVKTEEKKLQQQEELLNIQKNIASNQEAMLKKLDELIVAQNNTNVILQTMGGFQILE